MLDDSKIQIASEDISVLSPRAANVVLQEPYPYVVNEAPLPAALYEKLVEGFPKDDLFFGLMSDVKNNQAVRIAAADVIGSSRFSPEWRLFFEHHTSAAFWRDIVRVFGPALKETYPDLEVRSGRKFEDWRVKRRGEPGEAEISLDLLFVINTPVKIPSSVRPAHVDRRNKIFTGLFYMKQDEDPTPGGDLSLYRFKPGRSGFDGHYAALSDLDEVATVPYGANKFIAFVNSAQSIHGVTPRPVTPWTRRYINFVGEVDENAFALPRLPAYRRLSTWLGRRKGKSGGVDLKLPPPD